MPGSTTNFGFEYPLGTDPLSDGAQEIQNFAETADTTFADLLGGTTDQVLAKNSATDMDFKWVTQTIPTVPQGFIPFATGNYFGVRQNYVWSGRGSSNMPFDKAYFYAIVIAEDMTLDRIGVEITSGGQAANSTVRLGLYEANANYEPGNLILDAGTVSTATAGIKEITISQAVSKGIVFVVAKADTTGATTPNAEKLVNAGADNCVSWFIASSTNTQYFTSSSPNPMNCYTETVATTFPATASATVGKDIVFNIGVRRA